MSKRKKNLVGWIPDYWYRYSFREQHSHPRFSRIRTIRLYDVKGGGFEKTQKVRITIEEV